MTQPMPQTLSRKKTALRLIFIAQIVLALAVLISFSANIKNTRKAETRMFPNPNCLLNQGQCVAKLGAQAIALEIKSEAIRSATPMRFEVSLSNIEADQVMLDLTGKQMYMGLNQVMLQPVPDSKGRWQGDVTLAVCTTGEMLWNSAVIVEKDGQLSQASFDFNAQ